MAGLKKYITIHGHFYQPPRENPWLEEIQHQPSAAPFDNWNQRINYECYAPNRAARILNAKGKIVDILNNYEFISFNIGPTLMSWIEEHDRYTYNKIITADKKSQVRHGGHGNAIAQVYSHMIMPLANLRDKQTQVRWGIYDFERHFGRMPEGMWLAETAVDTETLEVLAANNIKFTILAPRQAQSVRKGKGADFLPVDENTLDTTRAYSVNLPSGNSIAVFFYDGSIAQGVAFGGLLNDGHRFANELVNKAINLDHSGLIHIATDGESYGHHHRFGEMALATCIQDIEKSGNMVLTNYGQYLELFPPVDEVKIHEASSWSCVHGVRRWCDDCGCNTGGHPDWNQQYRAPLRDGLNWLRDSLDHVFDEEGELLFKNHWNARNEYILVILDRKKAFMEKFLKKHLKVELTEANAVKAFRLLEMQRNNQLMFTSCGWFFDEISGLETVQILQYARRAITFAVEFGHNPEQQFKSLLAKIPGNKPELSNGLIVYEQMVVPKEIRLEQLAMHIAVLSIFKEVPGDYTLYKFFASHSHFDRMSNNGYQLIFGHATLSSLLTWATVNYSYAVLYYGQLSIEGFLKKDGVIGDVVAWSNEVKDPFTSFDLHEVSKLLHKYFGKEKFGFDNLFRDEKITFLTNLSKLNVKDAVDQFRNIYSKNLPVLNTMKSLNVPIQQGFKEVVSFVLNADLHDELSSKNIRFDKLTELKAEMDQWNLQIENSDGFALLAEQQIFRQLHLFEKNKNDWQHLENISSILKIVNNLKLPINLWQSQNTFFEIANSLNVNNEKSLLVKEIKEQLSLEA